MVTRVCISINNRCNLNCRYCHFHEKKAHIQACDMNVYQILDNIKSHIRKHGICSFKIGFVGNGEPLLDYDNLKEYILYIQDDLKSGTISAYTITNGLLVTEDNLRFFKTHGVSVGFSIDGIKSVHDALRCGSFDSVMSAIELSKKINGKYPPMNCTVGREVLDHAEETIVFFERFDSRITFSRMIGQYGITMEEFRQFIKKAAARLNVRTGGYDCTMYGGMCGAGINNLYYANGKIYICGNCIDIESPFSFNTPLDKVDFRVGPFDRHFCYKEGLRK